VQPREHAKHFLFTSRPKFRASTVVDAAMNQACFQASPGGVGVGGRGGGTG
jgi:hypothetical protein